ncbi:MAG TPA: hypothetical protein VFZ27_15725 [Terriglobia bacterium]|nr:hypothetical protein [Terriglobia bacterium]
MRVTVDHHDAELMLRLYDLRREEKLRRARDWFIREFEVKPSDDYIKKYPPDSQENAFTRMVVTYWEMVGSIVNSGLIEQDFFFQNTGEFFFVWEKIKPLAPAIRETFKNPLLWKNLEKMAESYEEWMNKRAPEAIAASRERTAAVRKK